MLENVENINDVKIQVIGQDLYDCWWSKDPPIAQKRRMAQTASVEDVRSPRTLARDTVPRTFQRDREKKVQEAKPSETKDVRAKDATEEVLARR